MSNIGLAHALLQKLWEQGVREIVLCAGARNAPFVSLLSVETPFEVYSFFEERSAAFFALGRSLSTARPVAVVTTSGTAAAELLPATIEADHQGVPLVLITADRPRHYRGSGAPQAIQQVGILSHYVEHCWDIESELPAGAVISKCRPTHFNVCMDEPLLDEPVQAWAPSSQPVSLEYVDKVGRDSEIQCGMRRPLILLGGLREADRGLVLRWLQAAQRPVLAEATSGLRGSPQLEFWEVRGGPSSLREIDFDGVIRIGGVPTVRLWRDLEKSHLEVQHFSHLPFSGMARVALVRGLLELESLSPEFEIWSSSERARDRERATRLEGLLNEFPLSEPAWVRWLSLNMRDSSRLFLGNSLPIREWDLAAVMRSQPEIFANRGANGIDGLISTFLGLSEPGRDNWCLLGDLSAMYDLSGPWALRERPVENVQVAILNNGGGKIFHRMFRNTLFENPHDIRFGSWAEMWGWDYLCFEEPSDLSSAVRPRVLELRPCAEQTEKFWQSWEKSR